MSNITAKAISSNLSSTEQEAVRDNIGLGEAATVNTGTANGEVPLNSNLGSAAYTNTGTGNSQVPLNSNLGDAAYQDNATSTQINTGTSTNRVVTPSGLKGSAYNPDNRKFTSSAQVISSGGQLTLAHGLTDSSGSPVTPFGIMLNLKCTTAEHGYSVGDILQVSHNGGGAAGNKMSTIKKDATNIYVQFSSNSSVFYISESGTGNFVNITNSRWSLYILAWY